MRPASSPPTVFARNRAARFGSMSMPAPVNCVMNCWRIQAGRFQAVHAADCDPIRADTLDGQLSWNGKPGWPPVSQDRMSLYPQLAQSEYYAKLRFYLAPGAKLYSLTIDPPDVTVWRVKLKSRLD